MIGGSKSQEDKDREYEKIREYQYAQMIRGELDKIRITGMKGFSLVIAALNLHVLKKEDESLQHIRIPSEIEKKAEGLANLIRDVEIWVPEDPTKEKDPVYMKKLEEERGKFVGMVKSLVEEKVDALNKMNRQDQDAFVKRNTAILNLKRHLDEKNQEIVRLNRLSKGYSSLDELRKATAKNVKPLESESYEQEFTQWRMNLLYPEKGAPLDLDEMLRLSALVDTKKYNWILAQVLPSDLPLAHWLSTKEISGLILKDLLVLSENNPSHYRLMTEPSEVEDIASQRENLQLLHGFVQKEILSIDDAIDWENLNYELLEDPEFQERLEKLNLTRDDLHAIEDMEISTRTLRNNSRRINTKLRIR